MVRIGEEQKNRLAQRLAMASHNREDSGQLLDSTARALQSGEDGSASQLEALVHAFENERVIVPIRVEEDPRVTGIHAGEAGHDPVGFIRVETVAGPAIATFTSAQSLSAYDSNARPMALSFRRLALAALVESAGKVIVDPSSRDILIPRSATSALAQGDHWLPAWKDQELRELLVRQAQDECSSITDLSVEYAGMGVCRVSLVIDPQGVEETDRAQLREKVLHAIDVLNSNKRLRAVADDIQWVPRWGTTVG